jgi:pyruvate kinase
LAKGAKLRLDLDPTPGTRERVPMPHPEVFAALKPGVQLLIDDGKMRFEVDEASENTATVRIMIGGLLSERKGVSVIGAVLPVSAMTDKDRTDLAFALQMGADWIALSFVQRPEDLDEVRVLARQPVWVMTKLEKPSAVERLDEIVARSDAVMVARGDLGQFAKLPAPLRPMTALASRQYAGSRRQLRQLQRTRRAGAARP